MSGHSKWNNIKRTKGVADAKKSAIFTRISKDIITAVQIGGSGDASFNPLLRVQIDKAKAANMPNEKIEKAINRGLGKSSSGEEEQVYSKTYEAYGPGGVAIIIDTETDNPNRTITDIRTIFTKNGYKLLNEGAISWKFKEVGRVVVKLKEIQSFEENFIFPLIEYIDLKEYELLSEEEGILELIVERDTLRELYSVLGSNFKEQVEVVESTIAKVALERKQLGEPDIELLKEFLDKVEEVNEVVDIWTEVKNIY